MSFNIGMAIQRRPLEMEYFILWQPILAPVSIIGSERYLTSSRIQVLSTPQGRHTCTSLRSTFNTLTHNINEYMYMYNLPPVVKDQRGFMGFVSIFIPHQRKRLQSRVLGGGRSCKCMQYCWTAKTI